MMLFDALKTVEGAQEFRKKRIKKIREGKVWTPLDETPFCVLHWLPISKEVLFKPDVLNPKFSEFIPIEGDRVDIPNLDGIRSYPSAQVEGSNPRFFCNAQVFHSGALEMVFVLPLEGDPRQKKQIHPRFLIKSLWIVMDKFKECMLSFEIDVPIVVGVSFFHVLKYRFAPDPNAQFVSGILELHAHSDREQIILPEALMGNSDDMKEIERPIFDMLWRSFGLGECPYYNEDGTRKNI